MPFRDAPPIKQPRAFERFIERLPAGVVEDIYEFLVSIALGIAGAVDFLVPGILTPGAFNAIGIPDWLVVVWGLFFVVGAIATVTSLMLRSRLSLNHFPRTLESVGLSFLGSATFSYVIVDLIIAGLRGQITTGVVVSALLLSAVGVSFILRVIILSPGVYERVLRNELEREVKRLTGK